jgi:DNA-binding XRE family transcriptional regulator
LTSTPADGRKTKRIEFVICVASEGCDDLDVWKVYRILPDAKAAGVGCIRVIDESGEDYIYPANRFVVVNFSKDVRSRLPRWQPTRSTNEQACSHRGKRITMPKTKDALKILERVTGSSEAIKAGIAEATINLEVAQMIYDARTKAGLSQNKLASLIGSKQSVIARLEDADYEGQSLTMLQRIAAALELRLELRFV